MIESDKMDGKSGGNMEEKEVGYEKWINTSTRLPSCEGRFLGFCSIYNPEEGRCWYGYLDVKYNPLSGWSRTESGVRDIYVQAWTVLPKCPTKNE